MKILITGSGGLIGSEVVSYFALLGHDIFGIDNNMRADFFGPQGDTSWRIAELSKKFKNFKNFNIDIRNRKDILEIIKDIKPQAIIHTAAQPSHDLSASRPFDDFDVNAIGTLNLLESVRRFTPDSVFVHMSTNKVYGDAINNIKLKELETRWAYDDEKYANGIDENFPIDQSKHSIFGASKLAADIMVQEYGIYFNMKTCCLRGGCLTGPNHCGVELHGFLSYLVKVNIEEGIYKIFGYKGKQVRDNIHSLDVARFIDAFIKKPKVGEVYNLGGGTDNSCSILEAFKLVEDITGKKMKYEYVNKNREGDHICYISNLDKIKKHYHDWNISIPLIKIFEEIAESWVRRLKK